MPRIPIPKLYDLTRGSSLNTLERLVSQSHPSPRTHCVIITHLMQTAEKYIDLVHRSFPVQLVIAIPYSVHIPTVERLKAKGIPVYLPDSVDDAFKEAGPLVEQILSRDHTPLVAQEIGGYLAGYTKELARYPHFKGIVEDTNNGHWRYHAAGTHPCPVLSMAQSPIKDIEDTVIGDAVIYSVERVFREEFDAILQGCKCGVIGYGKIGTSTAIALRGRECDVTIYDIDPCKNIRARFEGFKISPLQKLLSECDLIIGCTGKTSLWEEDIPFIKPNAILASASAKDEEFDLNAFSRACKLDKLNSVVWKYTKSKDLPFYLLNQGTPINFRDRSILGPILDMIYSELFLCMKEVAYGNPLLGLQHSPDYIHTLVAKNWLEVFEESFLNCREDRSWSFPNSLEGGVPRTFRLQTGSRGLQPAIEA